MPLRQIAGIDLQGASLLAGIVGAIGMLGQLYYVAIGFEGESLTPIWWLFFAVPAAVLGLLLAGGGFLLAGTWHKVGVRASLLNAAVLLAAAIIVLRGLVQGGYFG